MRIYFLFHHLDINAQQELGQAPAFQIQNKSFKLNVIPALKSELQQLHLIHVSQGKPAWEILSGALRFLHVVPLTQPQAWQGAQSSFCAFFPGVLGGRRTRRASSDRAFWELQLQCHGKGEMSIFRDDSALGGRFFPDFGIFRHPEISKFVLF